MRTTVDLDENVLRAARAIARDERVSLGAVLSRLARRGLAGADTPSPTGSFPVFETSPGATPIDLDAVNAQRDDA